MNKLSFGWNSFYEEWFARSRYAPGRVVRRHNHGYETITEDGVFSARLRGRIRRDTPKGGWPAVGDWVGLSFQAGYAMIEELAPRLSKISRKVSGKTSEEQVIAANADTLFLVTSLRQDYNPRKIERYLAMASESGAQPILVLNKSDLVTDTEPFQNEITSIAPDIPCYFTNALVPSTLEPLLQYTVTGRTVVLLGSSGTGKSTIVNELLGHKKQAVSAVGKNNKGVHTTSSQDMFFLKNGGILIDTPGIRELRVWLEGEDAIQGAFTDIEELSKGCRFRNCRHLYEPGCAVREALTTEGLSSERLENWRKITLETSELLIKRQETGRKPPQGYAQAYKQLKKSGRTGLR